VNPARGYLVSYKKGKIMNTTEKQLTVTVNKVYKDGQLVVAESSKETPIGVGLFQTATATVSVQATHTKNLGNYQSLKIGVIVSVPTYVEELDDAHEFAVRKVSEYLGAELKALDGDNVDPVEIVEPTEIKEEVKEEVKETTVEPKKRGRKKKEIGAYNIDEDEIPTFETAPTADSVENPTPVEEPKAEEAPKAVEETPSTTETVVEEQEVSASMLRGMSYDALVGIVEANELGLDISGYTPTEDGRKALAEDIIELAFPNEKEGTPIDGTEALPEVKEEEPVPATPVEEVKEEPKAEPAESVEQESVDNSDDKPYTFEELSDYSDDELHQIYEAWELGEFPPKRSMAIKKILEVQG